MESLKRQPLERKPFKVSSSKQNNQEGGKEEMGSIEEEVGSHCKTQDSISSLLSGNGRQSIPSCGLKRSVSGLSQISADPSNESSVYGGGLREKGLILALHRSMSEIAVFPREHLFDKALTPSDVGKLNRLVIPKHHAQRCFPLEDAQAENGIMLNFEDSTTGKHGDSNIHTGVAARATCSLRAGDGSSGTSTSTLGIS
ncbi:hypothetical protein SUGI_0082150 [Cryptomeria japonica]|uniref:B3 domain-containing protein Os04g0581400-like n=1 Tax=Cryptomeria japonica TaxID=3369 RepID=UPI002408C1C7|nr:B3 domain-containing protein Os04g0581400-like [Cryptomeria japonica]GLJ08148.1 hypothetical protein SUGI_0082150 [Cryptomeria japonica]